MAVPPTLHPTDETLRAYSLGQLDDILAEAVHRHLEDCPACRARAADMTSESFLLRLRTAVRGEGPEAFVPQVSVSFEPGRTSVLASLAESVGGLPRVLLRDTDPGEEPSPLVKPGSSEMPGHEDRAGRYQLLGEIARGGMGAVLRGRDGDIGRDLAIKVLLEAHKDKPELIRRFVEEAQIGGQLQHPGVVPIYDVGTFADRRPFFTMKLVKGQTLAYLLQGRKDPADGLPRFLSIFDQVCQTMAYAHTRGVIHRDLKPSNIMVGGFGEVQVMDWGLAKVLPKGGVADEAKAPPPEGISVIATARSGSDADASSVGSVLGTPAYMAPEQARGELDDVDERADVFGLGAILCEVLTGQAAFSGRSAGEVMRKSSRGELAEAFARLDACCAEPDLVALTKHCLAAEREDRPRNASEVAEAITAYLTGVQERLRQAELARVEANARAAEERKRHKLTLALAASIIGTILIGGSAWYAGERQRRERALQVDVALREAEALHECARRAGDDLSRWIEARDAARSVERLRADARDEATRRRVTDFVRDVTAAAAAAENDRKILDRLIDTRSAKEDDEDGSSTDANYAEAFRGAGIEVATLPPGEAGAKIKARPTQVAVALASTLDDWAAVRRDLRRDKTGANKLVQVARAADPDQWRNQLRDAIDLSKTERRLDALRVLARAAKIEELPPVSLNLLGNALSDAGDLRMAERIFRQALRHHPGDVWLNYNLASCLWRLARREEAIRYYSAARSIRPETAHVMAHLLEEKGELDEAIMVFEDLVRIRPDHRRNLVCLGRALKERGRTQEADAALSAAIARLREDLRRKPEDAGTHSILGLALGAEGKPDEELIHDREAVRIRPDIALYRSNLGNDLDRIGKVEEAIAAYREAIKVEPNYAAAHNGLGSVLRQHGKLEEAIAEFREAIRLQPDDARAHGNLADALVACGKRDEAFAEFREAIRRNPRNAWARTRLGILLREQGKRDEAVAEFREAIRLEPDDANTHHNLAYTLTLLGKREDAITEYREAIRLNPGNAELHENLAGVLREQGKVDEAIAELREAIRIKPDEPSPHNRFGIVLADQKKPSEAIAEYREAIRLKPDEPSAHGNLGLVLADGGKPGEAIAEIREAIRLKPDDSDYHSNLGIALTKAGKQDEAITAYQEAIRLNPADLSAHAGLGALLANWKHDHAGAEAELREAVRLKPDSADAHSNLGGVLYEQGKTQEAETEFREALRLKPDLASAHSNLGVILCDVKHDYEGGSAEFRAAIRLKPNYAEAHGNLGNALRNQAKYEAAIAAYREATRLKPDDDAAHNRLGALLCDWKRDYQGAIAEFREAIRLKPDSASAHTNLGNALRHQGKTKEAEAEYREAIRLNPNFDNAHNGLGALLCDVKHDYERAIAEFRAAIRLDPNDAEFHFNLANALRGQGNHKEAASEYREAIRLKPDHAEARRVLADLLRLDRRILIGTPTA